MADERVRSASQEKLVLHMSYKAHECLYILLRPERPGHDWKTLADFMGFTHQEIQYHAYDSNPVETIITVWERRPGSSVSQLLEYLEEMERGDIIEDFQRFVDKAPTPLEYEKMVQARPAPQKPEETKLTVLPDDEEYDAFLCYGKGDLGFAEEVCRTLEEEPYRLKICIDFRDIIHTGGYISPEAVMASVISKRCKKILVILSENFNKSEGADFQAKIALNLSPGAWQRPLIPILYQPCEIPIIYRFIYHLDYTNERARVYFWDKLARSLGYNGPQIFARSTSVKEAVVELPSEDAPDGQSMEEKKDVKESQTVHQVEDNSGVIDTSLVNDPEKCKKIKNTAANQVRESKSKKILSIPNFHGRRKKNNGSKPQSKA